MASSGARYGTPPTLAFESDAWAAGHETVVGVDEVGRGAWAGPLMVGAAVLPTGPAGLWGAGFENAPRRPS